MTRLVQMKVVGEPIILLTDVESDFDPKSTTASIGFLTRDPIGYWDKRSGKSMGLGFIPFSFWFEDDQYEFVASCSLEYLDPDGQWFLIDDLFTGPIDEIIVIGGIIYILTATGIIATQVAPPITVTLPRVNCVCPACPPPPPPHIRYDKVPPSAPHWPCLGSHTHVYWYETNQLPWPACTCFNNSKNHVVCH